MQLLKRSYWHILIIKPLDHSGSDKVFLDPPSRVEAREEQGANGNEERDSNCPKEGSPNGANRSPSILTKEHLPYLRRSRQEERNDATHKREHSPENGGDAGDAHRSELNGRERRDWRSSWKRPDRMVGPSSLREP
ncbi:hypothetical protein NL676_030237 [Syzygium grande]|nr:hypothetical protein NL676_030237 [Syzygium grande]